MTIAEPVRLYNERMITPFLERLERSVRLTAVAGFQERLQSTLVFVRGLTSLIEEDERSMHAANDEKNASSNIWLGKIKSISNRIRKSHTSLLGAIARIANVDRMSNLNNEQKAQFLRRTGGRSGRHLARRVEKNVGHLSGDTLEGRMRNELIAFVETVTEGHADFAKIQKWLEEDDLSTCWLTTCNTADMLRCTSTTRCFHDFPHDDRGYDGTRG